jgi:hypothetical protein
MTPSLCVTPNCAQCHAPMSLERIEPHAKVPDLLVQTFRCDLCRLSDKMTSPRQRSETDLLGAAMASESRARRMA